MKRINWWTLTFKKWVFSEQKHIVQCVITRRIICTWTSLFSTNPYQTWDFILLSLLVNFDQKSSVQKEEPWDRTLWNSYLAAVRSYVCAICTILSISCVKIHAKRWFFLTRKWPVFQHIRVFWCGPLWIVS